MDSLDYSDETGGDGGVANMPDPEAQRNSDARSVEYDVDGRSEVTEEYDADGRSDLGMSAEGEPTSGAKNEAANATKGRPSNCRRNLILIMVLFLLSLIVTLAVVLTLNKKNKGQNNLEAQGVEAAQTGDSDTETEAPVSLPYNIISPLVDDPASLEDPSTPQGAAFLLVSDMTTSSAFELTQRFSLLTLYYSTAGMWWRKDNGWETNDDYVCGWYGINTCDSNDANRIVIKEIDLSVNNLVGSIPSEICLLSDLETLKINGNTFSGGMPSCLAEMTDLQVIL